MPLDVSVSLRMLPISEVDLAPVAALVNRAFNRYSHLFTAQRTSASDYRDEAGEAARIILVEEGGRLVASGMVAAAERFAEPEQLGPAGTERPALIPVLPPEHPWNGAMYFGLAGVEPELMNRGLGRLMVRHVEELAASEGFPRIALGTMREFGLVEYYRRLDYRVIHEVTHPAGHWDFLAEHHYCEMVKHL